MNMIREILEAFRIIDKPEPRRLTWQDVVFLDRNWKKLIKGKTPSQIKEYKKILSIRLF